MKLVRFTVDGRTLSGVIEGDHISVLDRGIFGGSLDKGALAELYQVDEVTLTTPCHPSKIVAIGLNYKAHAEEFNNALPEEPLLFLKPSTSVIGPGDEIKYPSHMSRRVDFEAELGVVIGKKASSVEVKEAREFILGYTCVNDVTARDLQKCDRQWSRAKGFDTFAPIGPWIETELNPDNVTIESFLNGELRQQSSTSDMIFNVDTLVSYVSKVMTLLPGDVIATGTPSGVGKMKPGDTIEVRVEGIGSLVNTVTGE